MRLIGMNDIDIKRYNDSLDLLYDLAMNKVCNEQFVQTSSIKEVEDAYKILASLTGRDLVDETRDGRSIIELEAINEGHTNG